MGEMVDNKSRKMTQADVVLNHLTMVGNITSLEAFTDYGITRLSAVIYILRHNRGLNICSENVSFKTRLGRTGNYSKYYLVKSCQSESRG